VKLQGSFIALVVCIVLVGLVFGWGHAVAFFGGYMFCLTVLVMRYG
jgi:hypothetical protein